MKKILGCLIVMALIPVAFFTGCSSPSPTSPAAQAAVNLGTAGTYAVLAGSMITNTGATSLCGNLGLYPGTSVGAGIVFSCAGNSSNVGPANGPASIAQGNLATAYSNAQARTSPVMVTADIGGKTLYPGLYQSPSSLMITGTLTLNGQGNQNAVFIFQIPSSTLTTPDNNSHVLLTNGAKAANVYWQVGSSATLGQNTSMVGIIMAFASITLKTGATVEGRVLAENGQVTFDNNTISNP